MSDSDLVLIGRVLHEDAEFLTLQVPKSLQTELHLAEGDTFYTLCFLHQTAPSGPLVPWRPWEEQP